MQYERTEENRVDMITEPSTLESPLVLNWITYNQLATDTIRLAEKIGRDFTGVFGVPRFGRVAAAMFSGYTGVPMILEPVPGCLIIDDSYHSGEAMSPYREMYGDSVSYAAVYGREGSPDWLERHDTKGARVFEWELWDGPHSGKFSWDIDGVLCPDYVKGTDYIEHLETAPVLYRPRVTCKAIITGRYERYRKHTEAWLEKNGIEYKQLIMSKRQNDKERKMCVAKDKAKAAKKCGVMLHIESSKKEAQIIGMKGVDCICITNKKLYRGAK